MTGILEFENGGYWQVKGYIFERFLKLVIEEHRNDDELVRELTSAIIFQLLDLPQLCRDKRDQLVVRILKTLEETATRITTGTHPKAKNFDPMEHLALTDLVAKIHSDKAATDGR